MEAGRCTLSWAGTGGQFEGLSPPGPALLKKPEKNWPGTRSQGAKGTYRPGREYGSRYLHQAAVVAYKVQGPNILSSHELRCTSLRPTPEPRIEPLIKSIEKKKYLTTERTSKLEDQGEFITRAQEARLG